MVPVNVKLRGKGGGCMDMLEFYREGFLTVTAMRWVRIVTAKIFYQKCCGMYSRTAH